MRSSAADWAADFDILDRRYILDPASIWSQLRASLSERRR